MDFDKTRVYTAANADELKVGSKCIFDNTLYKLREKVQKERGRHYYVNFSHEKRMV